MRRKKRKSKKKWLLLILYTFPFDLFIYAANNHLKRYLNFVCEMTELRLFRSTQENRRYPAELK